MLWELHVNKKKPEKRWIQFLVVYGLYMPWGFCSFTGGE